MPFWPNTKPPGARKRSNGNGSSKRSKGSSKSKLANTPSTSAEEPSLLENTEGNSPPASSNPKIETSSKQEVISTIAPGSSIPQHASRLNDHLPAHAELGLGNDNKQTMKSRSEDDERGAETQGLIGAGVHKNPSDVKTSPAPPDMLSDLARQEDRSLPVGQSLPLRQSTEHEATTGQNTQIQHSKDDKGDKSKSRGSLFVSSAAKFIPGFMKPTKVEEVEAAAISPSDILIGVMGPTGSGKSSFISKATGFQGGVGHDLKSCTNKVTTIRFSLPELVNNDIVFVDTPGFDDTNLPDTKILEMISDWLNQSYGRGIRLNGLLYFHRISDNRMAGTPLKNLRLFEKICGEGFDNVIMTTTMWDEVEDEEGDQREKELADIYWKTLIKRGSQVRRFYHTQESAFQVIASILKDANDADNKRIQQELENLGNVLLLQKEVMVGGKELSDTEAGRTLFLQLQVLVEKHQKILERIRENLREPNLTPEELQDLMKDYQKVADDLKKATEEMQTIAAKKGVSIGRLQKLASTPRNFYHFLQRFNIFRLLKK